MKKSFVRIATAAALSALVTSASAAVYTPQQQLPATTIDAFKLAPSDLLTNYPSGGAGLTARVRDLGASDPSTLPLLIELLKAADPSKFTDPQKAEDGRKQALAIAGGLAQIARLASRSPQEQGYATDIQTAVLTSGNSDAIAEYRRLIGDVAIGAAGGGGGGGGGSGTGGSTGTSGLVFGNNNTGLFTSGVRSYATSPFGASTGSVGSVVNGGGISNPASAF